MKFNKSGQLLLVSAASLLVAGLVTACGSTLTVDFVFVATSKAAGPNNYGEVDVFEVNSESGFMRQIPTSPFPSGGRNPVAEAVSSDNTNLYVVNQDDNSIVQFIIGNDGKVYPQNTVNTPGIAPLAVAVNGANLFVVDTYQPLPTCSSAAPCSGSVAVYPISATTATNGALGTPLVNCTNYLPLGLGGTASADIVTPTGVNVLPNGSDVFIAAHDATANSGYIFRLRHRLHNLPQRRQEPHLDSVAGSPWKAGTNPSAVASDPSNTYVYVTDAANGVVLGYAGSIRHLGLVERQPLRGRQSALRAGYRLDRQVRLCEQRARRLGHGLLHKQRSAQPAGYLRHGRQPVSIGIDPSRNESFTPPISSATTSPAFS